MLDGFITVAAATPEIEVANTKFNADSIIKCVAEASRMGAKVTVLPELCMTGYTCGDLFLQPLLIKAAEQELGRVLQKTAAFDMIVVVGMPIEYGGKLYNSAVACFRGKPIAAVPKVNIPNYGMHSEGRYFESGEGVCTEIELCGADIPFSPYILINDINMKSFSMAIEICEDLYVANSPSAIHVGAGAKIIANLSASPQLVGSSERRLEAVKNASSKLCAGYIFASAGEGESTSELVYSGDRIICEDGKLLARSEKFSHGNVYARLDLEKISAERRKTTTFNNFGEEDYITVRTELSLEESKPILKLSKTPFIPDKKQDIEARAEEILMIQSHALKKRISHTHSKTAVIGISGGLDSTLALLVAVRAFDLLGRSRKEIVAVTMPCFGTTDRTYNNALDMAKALGVSLEEVNIREAVEVHLKDIGQPEGCFDVTFENAQARERTQVLMDIANRTGGIVVGTGDLSEVALGWSTYNGDHMSMYGVNASVPKTLIRHIVEYEAEYAADEVLSKTLRDVLDTPVSPELLPPSDGRIAQQTESIVGPYVLHDFFLYYSYRYSFPPKKVLRLAKEAFDGEYDDETLIKWLSLFYRRFFTQQFKRSCVPDSPAVGSVGLSPFGGWRMPADVSSALWQGELETIEKG